MVLTFLSYPSHLQLSPIHIGAPGVRTAVPRKRRDQSSVDCKLGATKQGEARCHDFNFPAIVSGDAIEIQFSATRAPASRQTLAAAFSRGLPRFLSTPQIEQAALW